MAQSVSEPEETPERKAAPHSPDYERRVVEQRQETYDRSQGYGQVISSEMRIYFALATVIVILLMAEVVATDATWLFAPVYVGIAVTYIAGALYLFKKLFTH